MADYVHPGALVETGWLAEHLDNPEVMVIEVDEDTSAYQKGHIGSSRQRSLCPPRTTLK
jgi:thiosulfate/3-mercaptopyruvate sulfurtransferase